MYLRSQFAIYVTELNNIQPTLGKSVPRRTYDESADLVLAESCISSNKTL